MHLSRMAGLYGTVLTSSAPRLWRYRSVLRVFLSSDCLGRKVEDCGRGNLKRQGHVTLFLHVAVW